MGERERGGDIRREIEREKEREGGEREGQREYIYIQREFIR